MVLEASSAEKLHAGRHFAKWVYVLSAVSLLLDGPCLFSSDCSIF
jgi:hypothetical protein